MGVSCVFYSTQIYKLLTAVNDHRRVYRCTGVLWAQAPRLAKRMGNVLCTLSSSAMYYSREDLNVYGAGGGAGGPRGQDQFTHSPASSFRGTSETSTGAATAASRRRSSSASHI